jgi:hypothetical protein
VEPSRKALWVKLLLHISIRTSIGIENTYQLFGLANYLGEQILGALPAETKCFELTDSDWVSKCDRQKIIFQKDVSGPERTRAEN